MVWIVDEDKSSETTVFLSHMTFDSVNRASSRGELPAFCPLFTVDTKYKEKLPSRLVTSPARLRPNTAPTGAITPAWVSHSRTGSREHSVADFSENRLFLDNTLSGLPETYFLRLAQAENKSKQMCFWRYLKSIFAFTYYIPCYFSSRSKLYVCVIVLVSLCSIKGS